MRFALYKAILDKYNEIGQVNCIPELRVAFPQIPLLTLESIVYQVYQRRMEKEFWEHKEHRLLYYEQYQEAVKNGEEFGILIRMAEKLDLSPALVGRLILEQHYLNEELNREPNTASTESKALNKKIIAHIKHTELINDAKLAAEIHRCNLLDGCYGPMADATKRAMGADYEVKLRLALKQLNIPCMSEKAQRNAGLEKTPDILLEVPIAINGRIVNWIESKASFGDFERHVDYIKKQYVEYRRRFGSGLVIYWFGFLDDLIRLRRRHLMVSNHMPANITFMNPEVLLPQHNLSWKLDYDADDDFNYF